MAKLVAFLRGMNLGGRRISNTELVKAFEQAGFEGAAAFRASGNVVFESAEGDRDKLSGADRVRPRRRARL